MKPIGLILAIASGLLYGLAIVYMKSGISEISFKGLFQLLKDVLSTRFIILSFFMSVGGYILSTIALKYGEAVVTALTISGFTYIALIIASHLLLNESVTAAKIVGAILIFAGIVSITKF